MLIGYKTTHTLKHSHHPCTPRLLSEDTRPLPQTKWEKICIPTIKDARLLKSTNQECKHSNWKITEHSWSPTIEFALIHIADRRIRAFAAARSFLVRPGANPIASEIKIIDIITILVHVDIDYILLAKHSIELAWKYSGAHGQLFPTFEISLSEDKRATGLKQKACLRISHESPFAGQV